MKTLRNAKRGPLSKYRVIEEIGDSKPREWRILGSGLYEVEAAKLLRRMRGTSMSARFAERETADDTLYVSDYDNDGNLVLTPVW